MKFLGFYLGVHDSNLCMYDTETRDFKYVKSERKIGIKRHHADVSFIGETCAAYNFSPDYVAFSDGDRNGLGLPTLTESVTAVDNSTAPFYTGANWFNVDHHLAHVLSVWPIQRTEGLDWGIAIDGRGDHERRISIFKNPSSLSPAVFSSEQYRICHLFDFIGTKMNLKGHVDDFAGKIMGAQAYGIPQAEFINQQLASNIDQNVFSLVEDVDPKRWGHTGEIDTFFDFKQQSFRNWLASVHAITGQIVFDIFMKTFEPQQIIAYSGGCALNTVYNQMLAKRFGNIIIPPHCYDGGLSLGCIEALRILTNSEELQAPGFPFIQDDEDFGYAGVEVINETVKLLAEGKIVGWLQGRGEIGPRSLGHRALLLSPTVNNGKCLMNQVKLREDWRPFAPSVLYKEQEPYFCTDAYRPFMLHTTYCSPLAQSAIPSVVHVDDTSRIQSVDARDCPPLESYEVMLSCLHDTTGHPVVLNTSYNAGGKPIVSTRKEALDMFKNTKIDAIVLGNELIRKT